MSEGNAFAQMRDARPSRSDPEATSESNRGSSRKRPAKRVKLSPEAQQEIFTREADPETALEVDHMILDYMVHEAIFACLENYGGDDDHHVDQQLKLIEFFLTIFKSRHPLYRVDAELSFRLKLLKLVALYTQRLRRRPSTPTRQALEDLRKGSSSRAREWIGTLDRLPTAAFTTSAFEDELPLSPTILEYNRARVLQSLGSGIEDASFGTPDSVSLLDMLPFFMQVTAAIPAFTNFEVNEKWMRLASDFMLQACLEQYLIVGAYGLDAVDECFAWGFKVSIEDHDDEDAADETNAIFKDVDGPSESSTFWGHCKKQLLQRFSNVGPGRMLPVLEDMSEEHPLSTFDRRLIEYITGLTIAIAKPVLVQLEDGKLADLTEDETTALLQRVSCQ